MMRWPEVAPRSGSARISATSDRTPLPHKAPTRIAISYFRPYVGITRRIVSDTTAELRGGGVSGLLDSSVIPVGTFEIVSGASD
jgi:hypothetical protein